MVETDASKASYIGIDPSLNSTGVAVLTNGDCNVFLHQPPKKYSSGVIRLAWHFDMLSEILKTYKPFHSAIEGPSLGSVNRADDIGQLRGVFLLELHHFGIPTTIVQPTSLKKYGARSGSATKSAMIRAATVHWPGVTFNDDTADAVWLAHIARGLRSPTIGITRPQMEVLRLLRNK